MKALISAVALIATVGAASAGQVSVADDYIKQANKYDAATSSTVPGVVVRVNGQNTHYAMDGSNGLTRSIIFSDTGIEAEAWAKDVLGLDVTARLNPGDKESEPSFAH